MHYYDHKTWEFVNKTLVHMELEIIFFKNGPLRALRAHICGPAAFSQPAMLVEVCDDANTTNGDHMELFLAVLMSITGPQLHLICHSLPLC